MNIIAALLIAVGLIIGGFLAGGRYHVIVPPKTETHDMLFLIEVDRFTGGVRVCLPSDKPNQFFQCSAASVETSSVFEGKP